MKSAKPRHVETRVRLSRLVSASLWAWFIAYRIGKEVRVVTSPIGGLYTRRSDAKRGAARAWARIQRECR